MAWTGHAPKAAGRLFPGFGLSGATPGKIRLHKGSLIKQNKKKENKSVQWVECETQILLNDR